MEEIPLGVTKPSRAFLTPGGPFGSMAWKPLRPGLYDGAWESYKSEIAAYELDKLLELHMTPPTVERQIDGRYGAAIMWIAPVTMARHGEIGRPATAGRSIIAADVRRPHRQRRSQQGQPAHRRRRSMPDRRVAGVLGQALPLKMEKVDAMQWGRISALTEESLTASVGTWLDQAQIRALLDRRARIKQEIDKLVASNGAEKVFVAEGKQ
jgi:hypothetical protein